MKIAITGGAGFIGRYLTKAYLDAGHDVLVLDNMVHKACPSIDTRARVYHIDIRDGNLRTILQKERPEIVSHHVRQRYNSPIQQALTDADIHVRGLLHVLDCCVNASVKKFIFASSGNDLYGRTDSEKLPLTEDTPPCPSTAYDISKAAGEWYVRYYTQQFGLKHSILRYADVYGDTTSKQPRHPLNYFINMLTEQCRPIIRGSGNEIRDHIFINDVVLANLCALKRGENRTLHISSNHGVSLNQIYHMVAHIVDSKLEPIHLSGPLLEHTPTILDNTRARQQLGWLPQGNLVEAIVSASTKHIAQTDYIQHTQMVDNIHAIAAKVY